MFTCVVYVYMRVGYMFICVQVYMYVGTYLCECSCMFTFTWVHVYMCVHLFRYVWVPVQADVWNHQLLFQLTHGGSVSEQNPGFTDMTRTLAQLSLGISSLHLARCHCHLVFVSILRIQFSVLRLARQAL